MHQGENYQDFLKLGGELLLSRSLVIIKWTCGFFSKNLQFDPLLPKVRHKRVLWSFTSANLDAVSQEIFKKNSTTFSFFDFGKFFRIDIKNNSWWKAQKILSKKVKQVLQGWRDKSCNGTAKETKVNHCENSTIDICTIFWVSFILMVLRWTRVSSCGCYVLERWLDIRYRYIFLINWF